MAPIPPLCTLLPHQGPMRWLDHVLSCSEKTVICRAQVRPDNPALTPDGLPCWSLVELMAQGAAVHQGLQHGAAGAVGFLASLRDVHCQDRLLPLFAPLHLTVQQELSRGTFHLYRGTVCLGGPSSGAGQRPTPAVTQGGTTAAEVLCRATFSVTVPTPPAATTAQGPGPEPT